MGIEAEAQERPVTVAMSDQEEVSSEKEVTATPTKTIEKMLKEPPIVPIAPKPVFPRPVIVIGLDLNNTPTRTDILPKKRSADASIKKIILPHTQPFFGAGGATVFVGFDEKFLQSDFAKELPSGYEYYKSKRKLRLGDDSLKMHLKVHTIDELMKWFSDYSDQSSTTWRVSKTYPKGDNRHSFKKEYHCQHKNVSRPDRPDPKKSPKNLHCPALMTIALLKDNLIQSNKQKDSLAVEGYLGYILFTHQHNHDKKCDVVLKHRDVSKETELKLVGLFKSGKNPRAALEELRSDLYMNNSPAEFTTKCGDRSVCPDINYCYRLYYKTMGKPIRDPTKEPKRKRRKTAKGHDLSTSDLDTFALQTLADLGSSAIENRQAVASMLGETDYNQLSDYSYMTNQPTSYASTPQLNQASHQTMNQSLGYPNNQQQDQPASINQAVVVPSNMIAQASPDVTPNPEPTPTSKQPAVTQANTSSTPQATPALTTSGPPHHTALVTRIHNFSRKLLTLSTQEKHQVSLAKFLDHFKGATSDTKFIHTLDALMIAPATPAVPPSQQAAHPAPQQQQRPPQQPCVPAAAVIQNPPQPPLSQQQQMQTPIHRSHPMTDQYTPNNYPYHPHATYRQL